MIFFWGKTYKTTNVFSCQNEKAEFNNEKSEAHRWKGERAAMLKGLRASTLRGAFEIYTVTRAQIALAYCTSSWARCLRQRRPHSALPSFLRFTLLFLPFRFASLHDHKTPSCTLRKCISEPNTASHTQTLSLLGASDDAAEADKPPPHPRPQSWKRFYSFNIISLNNDSVASRWGCRELNQMESRLTATLTMSTAFP